MRQPSWSSTHADPSSFVAEQTDTTAPLRTTTGCSFGAFEGVDVDDVGVCFVGVCFVGDEVFAFPFGSFGGGLDTEPRFLPWFGVAAWCDDGLGGGSGVNQVSRLSQRSPAG